MAYYTLKYAQEKKKSEQVKMLTAEKTIHKIYEPNILNISLLPFQLNWPYTSRSYRCHT